jgi:hypothetical protein
LKEIFLVCKNDKQLHKKSIEIEKHLHKIKGLAPMMGQEKVGEIARISDIILKYIINQGVLKDSHKIISESVQRMNQIFNENSDIVLNDFIKNAKSAFPQIIGF